MLWSLLKIVVFLAIAALLAFGAVWILDTPGEVSIAFGNREFLVSPIGFVVALCALVLIALVILKIVGFLAALVRFLLGDETAISRYFRRSRERRGFDALTDGMLALAAGDGKGAARKAAKAEKLLDRPDLTRLLTAQAAELNGDRAKALDAYKSMLPNDRTRPVGIQGLMRQKLDEGDTETALALAKKAFALQPDNERVLRTLFDLQSRQEDWSGARETLNASMHARLLPRDVGTRRDAVLSLADARAALAAGDTKRGNEAALQANRLAPTLVPAAALAARVHASQGAKRKANKALTAAWSAGPQPELAAAFAAIEPDETPAARRKRFETLIAAESRPRREPPARRRARARRRGLPRRAQGARRSRRDGSRPPAASRSWRRSSAARARPRRWCAAGSPRRSAPSRGPQWICGKCNHVHAAWVPVCENCGAFDTLDWRTPPHDEGAGLAQSAMLPLIIGTADEPAAPPTPPPPPPRRSRDDAVDAELASVADQARAAGVGS